MVCGYRTKSHGRRLLTNVCYIVTARAVDGGFSQVNAATWMHRQLQNRQQAAASHIERKGDIPGGSDGANPAGSARLPCPPPPPSQSLPSPLHAPGARPTARPSRVPRAPCPTRTRTRRARPRPRSRRPGTAPRATCRAPRRTPGRGASPARPRPCGSFVSLERGRQLIRRTRVSITRSESSREAVRSVLRSGEIDRLVTAWSFGEQAERAVGRGPKCDARDRSGGLTFL
jgi:hypothetical protein